jgi:hypothetical protein
VVDPVRLTAGEYYALFETWVFDNKRKYETTKQAFGMKLSNLRIKGVSKGEKENKGNGI